MLAAVAVAGREIVQQHFGTKEIDRGPIDRSSVVMLGDSLTEQGRWTDLLPVVPVVNQGYAGFTTEQLVDRADAVAARCPRVVFVLAGTNDIRDARPPEWSRTHLSEILDRFAACATTMVLHTIPPRADAVARVAATNATIRELASSRGVPLIDLHRVLDDGAGGLRPNETTDQIHLSDEGYRRWATEIRRTLDTLSGGDA